MLVDNSTTVTKHFFSPSYNKVVTLKIHKACIPRPKVHTSDHITMLCGASVAGIPLPSMIIFYKSISWSHLYTFEGPDDAVYVNSDLGWLDSNLLLWVKKSFLKFAVPERPLIVLVEGDL